MSSTDRPRTLLVAATGGHLEQLFRLSQRFSPSNGETLWVTHDDDQSRSLLQDQNIELVPYVPPRGFAEAARIVPSAWRTLRKFRPDRVVSTGAGLAMPYFVSARAIGVPTHYIESAARADGPSLTGRMMRRLPGTSLYCQYPSWAHDPWQYRGALFDGFVAEDVEPNPIRSVVVTLGTMRTYGFRRLIDRLLHVLPQVVEPGADVLWQTGATEVDGLPGRASASIANSDLRAAIGSADLVIAHAGIGSAITALELGQRPVLVPRRTAHGEHIDEHQELIAGELGARGLTVSREADELTAEDLRQAARGRVVSSQAPPPFVLGSLGSTIER